MVSLTGLVTNNRQWFCCLLVSYAQVGSKVQGFDNQGMALECAHVATCDLQKSRSLPLGISQAPFC